MRPVLGLLVQAARDEVREGGGEGLRRECGGGVVDDLREEHEGVRVGRREGRVRVVALGALDEGDAERPDVGGEGVRLAAEPLWRHVGVRAYEGG